MSLAHLAIGSRNVQGTADFLCRTMGWESIETPANVPREVAWLDLTPQRDRTHQIHVIHFADFQVSPFEREFGRHLAVFHHGDDLQDLKRRLSAAGAEVMEPLRSTPFERFFFREPINGYVFEVINYRQWTSKESV